MTVQTIPSAVATSLPPAQVAKITQSAQQFEAMALSQLLAPIFDSVDSSKGPFGGSRPKHSGNPC